MIVISIRNAIALLDIFRAYCCTITRDTKTINTRLLTKDNYSFDIEECTWLYVWSITPFDKFNPTEMKFLRYKNLMRREIDEKQLCRN